MTKLKLIIFSMFFSVIFFGQGKIDYSNPQNYVLSGIEIKGIRYLDHQEIIKISGLQIGDTIFVPGQKISDAIKSIWKQELFADVEINISKIIADKLFIDIVLKERPRLSKFKFTGIRKGEADALKDDIKFLRGMQVNENTINNAKKIIIDSYKEKGFWSVKVNIEQKKDTFFMNNVIVFINVEKGNKFKISTVNIEGNEKIASKKIKRKLKDTKEKKIYRFWKKSKFLNGSFLADKKKVINHYNSLGYRNARIIDDSVYKYNKKTLIVDLKVEEGNKFYFRNITWVGNIKYKTEQLNKILNISKGDIYNEARLTDKLLIDQYSISSLYLDDGYLFFSATPIEISVENDSIDIEIQIYEGKQARINKITIIGNEKTNDKVILRELKTVPGELFSRTDLQRSIRELNSLGYFNPEKLDVNPQPNPQDGTVDLEYTVEEKASDQIEFSAGSGYGRLVFSLGLMITNFSLKSVLKKDAWNPLPKGDGQRISLRAQTTGLWYQSYNLSFIEPWFGGKKPNSLSVSFYHNVQTNGREKTDPLRSAIKIYGSAVGSGRRLNWPDDYFTLYNEVAYQKYVLNNYQLTDLFSDGESNGVSFKTVFSRNSIDQPLYPRKGSNFSLSVELTPPLSLFSNENFKTMESNEKYKWIEYHKWTVGAEWFTSIVARNLVLRTKFDFGMIGFYNKDIGTPPLEGFNVGGDGLSYTSYGISTIALRGYENGSLSPELSGRSIYNKFTMELRYPLSLNPTTTIYGLAFLEGGNAWKDWTTFNPFGIKRTAGLGVRIFLPMMGMLGVDWGYGFDKNNNFNQREISGGQFHFIIGQQF